MEGQADDVGRATVHLRHEHCPDALECVRPRLIEGLLRFHVGRYLSSGHRKQSHLRPAEFHINLGFSFILPYNRNPC